MNFSSKLLQDAVDEISRLPGIGKNTATRLALNLIKEKDENVLKLIAAIKSLKNGILFCEQCCNLSDKPICGICSNDKRDSSILCIVEDIRDVMAIENTGQFNGLYHVLGGKISPVDGVGPNQLTIDKLVDRVKKNNINDVFFLIDAASKASKDCSLLLQSNTSSKLFSAGTLLSTLLRSLLEKWLVTGYDSKNRL